MVTQRIGEREQLYMLEFLVNQLNLLPEILEESQKLSVHLKFLDFDTFTINQEEFSKNPLTKEKIIDFASGKSCVFSKKPKDLITKLQNEFLKIEIYPSNIDPCPSEPQKFICKTELHISGCFCEIESAMRDPSNLPDPYTLRNTYELLNEDEKSCGTIEIFLRLSCLGESIVTHFHVENKSFLFKNINSNDQFSCVKLPPNEEDLKNKFWTPKSKIRDFDKKPEPKTILGISAVCSDLIKNSPRISPEIPPLIIEDDLNSPEPPIHSKPETNEFFKKVVDDLIPKKSNFDVGKFISPRKFPCGGRSCPGGICSGPILSNEELSGGSYWRSSEEMKNKRLRGGNDERSPTIPIQSMQTLISGVCRSYLPEDEARIGCGCHTKMGNQSKIKKKCYGIDCLIKSFKEAEKFVDCIGRVPGMAGLGLMDPMESPYFGRPRYRPLNRVLEGKNTIKSQLGLPLMKKSSSILRPPKTFPSRHFDKYKPIVPGPKKLKRDDYGEKNIEEQLMTIKEPQMGPCGEPVCNSRRKVNKNDLDLSSKETLKAVKMKKASLLSTKRKNMKLNLKRVKNLRNYERNYTHVKVGKKVMRMVVGVSQRCCFGHRSCVEIRARVPGNMGWLWNTNDQPGSIRPKVGWKPGAISRRVWSILEKAKMGKDTDSVDERPVTPVKGKKGKISKSKSLLSVARSQRKKKDKDDEHELPPTLHIHRKNGDYYVTMYPVKPDNSNNPEVLDDVKPLQFKVTKDRNIEDDDGNSSSIGDDMEFEFSPPAAIHKFQKKVERKDFETQVVQQEILDAFKTSGGLVGKKKKKGGKK